MKDGDSQPSKRRQPQPHSVRDALLVRTIPWFFALSECDFDGTLPPKKELQIARSFAKIKIHLTSLKFAELDRCAERCLSRGLDLRV